MTILYRGSERGEILDADGKVVGVICCPHVEAYINEDDGEIIPKMFEDDRPTGFTNMHLAGNVDLSAAAVKVPERKYYPDINGNNGWAQWNACLDALGVES